MGVTAIGTEIVTGATGNGLSPTTVEGAAVGGAFVTIALIYTLSYIDLLDAADVKHNKVRRMLIDAILPPLGMVFIAIIGFEVLQIL